MTQTSLNAPVCPECGAVEPHAQRRSFTRLRFSFTDDPKNPVDYEYITSEDDDGPEWYTCVGCGYESDEIEEFRAEVMSP